MHRDVVIRRLLRTALAVLLAAPTLHHARAAAAPSVGVAPRDEVFAAGAAHRGPKLEAPTPKLRTARTSGPDLHPPAFLFAAAAPLPRGEAGAARLHLSRVPVPRSAKRPAYDATGPPC